MAWFYLVLAGLLEVAWAVGLKYTEGFTKLTPSILTVLGMIGSFALLGQALRVLPIGTAYAIWTGIGAVGTAIIGMIFLGEPRDVARILCILLIVAGIVGLKFTSAAG
jgi:quaternary ammonium compound-resistance protein SugE